MTTNLWTATQPHLIKALAVAEGFRFLNSPAELQMWEAETARLLQAAKDEYSAFEAGGPQGLSQESAYC